MKNSIPRTHLLAAAVAVGSATIALNANAIVLEEVVVTAQKRAESLQDVPVSVSALATSDLEGLKFRDSTEIAAQIPNLQSTNTSGDGFPIFSLRGVSMSDFSFNQSSPVASYVDEVYKGNPAIQGVQIFDLERIEVLRGPQGTLYGKNTTGGAVNFITKKPSFDTSGYITLGAGNYERREANGAFEAPLVEDTLAVRLAGTWTESDGWFKNQQAGVDDGNAVDDYGLRATLLWEASDALQVILRASTGKQDAVNYGIQPFNITADGVGAGLYALYNSLGATTETDYDRQGRDYFDFDSEQGARRTIENDALALTLNWDLTDMLTLTSITSWDDGEIFNPEDADGSPLQVLSPYYFGEAKQVSQDLRITSDFEGPLNFIGGLYYAKEEVYNQTSIGFWQDLDLNADGNLDFLDCSDPLFTSMGLGQVTPEGAALETVLNGFGTSLGDFAPAGCQIQNDFDQDRTSVAAYFDGSYDLSESMTLRIGLRYTEDETELANFSARILGNDNTPLANTIPGDPVDPFAIAVDDDFTDKEWSGKIGIDYTTEAGTLLYASYSHGFRSGAYNAQAFFDPSEVTQVAPEMLDSYEVGFKAEYLDGSMQLNGAAFYYEYQDQQFLNVDPTTLAQTLINIEESEVMGLELELVARPAESLLLRAGLGLLDSEVKKGSLSGVDLKGNELLLAPQINFNLAADWDVLTSDWGTLALHLDGSYVDDHYFEIFNVDRLQQKGYWLTNARLQFESADSAWQVALWSKNLGDEKYRTSVVDLQSSFGYDYSHVGAPRTFGADFTYRF
ncbi:MAG: TonB-dependent receptor [Pseudomonadales bacterium]